MMRVCHVGPYPWRKGGISSVIGMLVEQQRADPDFTVDTLCTSVDGTAPGKTLSFLSAMILLALRGLRRKKTILHVHTSCGMSFRRKVWVVRLGSLLGQPSLLHFHTGKLETMFDGSERQRRWARRQLDRARLIVVLTGSWVAPLRSLTDTPIEVVPNGLDLTSAPATRTYAAVERPLILFVGGSVLRAKGAFELLAAVERLSRAEPRCPVRLVIAGLGELGEAREFVATHALAEMVELAGWVDGERKRELLRDADMFALPSSAEGLPVALLEAMASGLPCIATPVGGVPELIQDGENGLLVPVGDLDALTRSIRRLAGDPALRRRLGSRARSTVGERHDIRQISRALKQHYKTLLSA